MINVKSLETFSDMGKEQHILRAGEEIEIFRQEGRGCLTHMWFALDDRVRVQVYVDGECEPSISMALDMGHGYAFGGSPEPTGSHKMGRYGGQFNNITFLSDQRCA